MNKIYKITLPWPYKELNPNARFHWSVVSKIKKRYRGECYILAKQSFVEAPKTEKIHLFVDFYKPDRRERDQDNFEASMKSGYDGLADALGVNDSRFVIHPIVRDEILKGGKVIITITGSPE